MLEQLNILLSNSDNEILKNESLLLKMLYLYSKLYLGGAPPNWCSNCHKDYVKKLRTKETLIFIEIMENRTCLLQKDTIITLSHPYHCQISNSNITDEFATELLTKGVLKENIFEKLPEMYLERKQLKEVKQSEQDTIVDQPNYKKSKKH